MNSDRNQITNQKFGFSIIFAWPNSLKCKKAFFRLLKTFATSMLISILWKFCFNHLETRSQRVQRSFHDSIIYVAKIFAIRIFAPQNAFVNWNSRCWKLLVASKTQIKFFHKLLQLVSWSPGKSMRCYHLKTLFSSSRNKGQGFHNVTNDKEKRYWKWIRKFLVMLHVTNANTIKKPFW